MKNVYIPGGKGQGKPLEICEHDDVAGPSAGHFALAEPEMKQVAEKMRKTFTGKRQDAPQ